jgi:hypothetical protein
MIDSKHCVGCYNNYYNPGCWSRKRGKMVWRIPVGVDQIPPYKQKAKRVPSCWRGGGSVRVVMVDKNSLTKDGYWK